jgi:hypothetical protein
LQNNECCSARAPRFDAVAFWSLRIPAVRWGKSFGESDEQQSTIHAVKKKVCRIKMWGDFFSQSA